jgi:hypothetical protein
MPLIKSNKMQLLKKIFCVNLLLIMPLFFSEAYAVSDEACRRNLSQCMLQGGYQQYNQNQLQREPSGTPYEQYDNNRNNQKLLINIGVGVFFVGGVIISVMRRKK